MPIWKVIGGADKGGIVVRAGRDLKSAEEGARLATGAFVEELQELSGRLQYRLLSGTGPATGWVSTTLKDKPLLSIFYAQEVPQKILDDAIAHESTALPTVSEEKIGSLTALVRRHEQSRRSPCAVVLCAGNPGEKFGSDHMNSQLMMAIDEALGKVGVPVVRFDYSGVGCSVQETLSGYDKKTVDDSQHSRDVKDVVEWTRRNISDDVVTCGYSYGGSQTMPTALGGLVHAYISVALGYNVFWFLPEGEPQKALKESMELHSKMACPALYVVGSKDSMTPLAEVKRLVGARSDGGAGVQIKTVEQSCPPAKAHAFTGQEAEVGSICGDFVAHIRNEMIRANLMKGMGA